MDAETLLGKWGFVRNPFREYIAEREENTPNIFIEPPYFKDILGNDPQRPYSAIVFGQRGDGKSTLCRMIELNLSPKNSTAPLLIRYTDFPQWSKEDIKKLTLEQHIERIIKIGLEEFISRAEQDIKVLQNLNNNEKAVLQWYVLVFFPFGEYKQIEKRLTSLIDKLPRSHRVKKIGGWGFRRIANYLRRKRVEIERVSEEAKGLGIIKTILFLVAPSIPESRNLRDRTDLDLLRKFRELTVAAGLGSIVVLVDKVDEDGVCADDPILAAELVRPIVTSVAYLELEGVATKLFLPYATKGILGNKIRTDRIITREISWSDDQMRNLLAKRLRAFSNGNINSLEKFVAPSLQPDFEKKLLFYSAQSPRNMIRLLDEIISILCELEEEPSMISSPALNQGIKNFTSFKLTEQDATEYQKRLDALSERNSSQNEA
jgi:hypothetical protein